MGDKPTDIGYGRGEEMKNVLVPARRGMCIDRFLQGLK